MEDLIIIVIIAIVIGFAGLYVYRKKKAGSKCIGCPYGDSCCKNSEKGGCGCHDHN